MLNERKILVTGSSSGIGQAITSQLLKAEVNVIGAFTFSTLMINTLEIVLVPSVAFRVML